MLIIFGTRTLEKHMGYARQYTCRNCGNVAPWRVIRTTLFFTLFFIPLIPLSRKYYVLCPVCNQGARISRQECEAELAGGTQPAEPAARDR